MHGGSEAARQRWCIGLARIQIKARGGCCPPRSLSERGEGCLQDAQEDFAWIEYGYWQGSECLSQSQGRGEMLV